MERKVYLPDANHVIAPDGVSNEEALAWAKVNFPNSFPVEAAPPKPKTEPGIASEIGSILKSGTGQGIASLGKLGQYAGIGGKGLEEYGAGMTQRATEALSPGTQAALQRQFLKEAPEGQGFLGYQLGDAKLTDIPAQALRIVPEALATGVAAVGATALAPASVVAGAGAGVLSILGRIGLGNLAGKIATAAGTKAGAELLAGKLVINTLAGNVSEGLAAAGSSGIETEKAVRDFAESDPDKFFQSPIGKQALEDADGDKKKAIELGAFRAGRSAAAYTGISTAILATPGSAFESLAVFGKGVRSSRLHSAIMGGITEGPAQELPQGSAEQYIQNLQRIQAGENISSGKGVLEAGVQGAIIGAPLGGALGAITGSGKRPEAIPATDVDRAFVAQHEANLDAGMEPHEAYMGAAIPVLAQAPEGAEFTVYDATGKEYPAQLVGRQDGTPLIQVDAAEKDRNYVLGDEFTITNPLNAAVTTSDGIPVSSLSGEALTNKVEEVHAKVFANEELFKQSGVYPPQYHIDYRDLTALVTREAQEKIPLTDKQKVQEQKDFNKQKREVVKSAKQPAPPVAEVPPPEPPAEVAPTIVAPVVASVPPPVVAPVETVVPPEVPPPVVAETPPVTTEEVVAKPKTQEEELQDQVDEETPTLPAELAKAAPRFNSGLKSAIPTFASDVDKAAFIVSGKGESARHQDYFDWVMKATGLTKEQVIDHGNQVRREIKDSMEDVRKDGTLYIPEMELFNNPHDRAIGELSNLSLGDLRKSEITAFANRLVKQGLVKETDLSDVREILKDKDQVADDAVGELESIIESSKPAKFSKTKGKAKEKSTTTAAETVAKRREATKQERVNRAIPRIAKLVSDRLAKIGLGKYIDPVALEAAIGAEEKGISGQWTHLITLAVNGKSDKQIMSTLDHESIHAMREIGMITPEEWKNLTAVAKAKDWIKLFNIESRYDSEKPKMAYDPKDPAVVKKYEDFEDLKYEEAIADAWSTYTTGRSPVIGYLDEEFTRPQYVYKAQLKLGGQPVGILTRIKKILGIIKDVAAEEKLGEDIFKRIEEAPIAATKPVQGAAPAKLSVTKADLGREKTGQLYEVYNRKTGKVVGGPYQTRSAARSGADRNDNKYGGYAHDVREVQEFGSDEGPEPTKQDLKKAREEEKLEALDEAGVNPKFSLALKKKTITQRSTQDDLGPVFVYTGDRPETLDEYLKESTIKKDGLPRIGFHGTAQDISTFRAKQAGAIFVSFDPDLAAVYSQESAAWMADHADEMFSTQQIAEALKNTKRLLRENGYNASQIAKLSQDGILKTDEFREAISVYMPSNSNILPMFVRAENPFDYENKEQVKNLLDYLGGKGGLTAYAFTRANNWQTIEDRDVQKAIKELGYDSFYVSESFRKNLAVYDSSQLKSAIGNNGEYDPKNDNIKLSVAPKRSSDIGHKQEKSSGRYIGAPKWVGSSAKNLNLLGSRLDKLAEEGAVGKYWYERSSKAILDMVNGDKKSAEKFVGLVALFSAGNQVSNNMGAAIKAWYEWKNTGKITAGRFPATQGPKAERWLNDGIDYGGIKVNNFYTDLMEEIEPASVDKEHSTMDMWMALAGDYGSKILDQGPKYLFMQREIKRIADNMGWKPHQVQAAIWTAIKARVEKSEADRKAYELRKGIAVMKMEKDADTGKMTLTHTIVKGKEYDHFRAASKFGFDSSISKEEIDSSFYDFKHSIEERTVQLSSEAIPGVTSGVLPGIHDAPMWQKIEYSEAVRAGKFLEIIYKKLGMLSSIGGVSFSGWQGVTTVGQQDKIAVRVLNGEVTPESKLLINFAADIYGLVTSQEGVAWHFPIKDSVKFGLNGIDIDIGRKLTESQTDNLYKLLIKELGSTYSPPIPTDTGFRVLNFPDAKLAYDTAKNVNETKQIDLYNKGILTKYQIALSKENEKFFDGVIRALNKFPYLARSITRFRSDGELRENNWSNGNEDYKERITRTIQELSYNNSRIGFTDLQKWINVELLSGISTINQRFAKKYGWGTVADAKQEKLDLGEQAKFSAAPRRYEQTGDGRGVRGKSGRITPLQGSPSVPSVNGPDSRIVAVAQRYARDNGINFKRQSEYVKVDPERGKRLSDAYEAMAHDPQDPVVKEAYANLMKQTLAQYRALENAGYKFWFINFAKPENQTYAKSPWNAIRDIRANQEMGVFPTTSGFGTDESDFSGNPLLEDTGIKWPDGGLDGPLKPVLANDLFRAVHDAFGHGLEGAGFRADGEDNAWQSHIRMYTGSAKGAITSETRGQNSVVNYGPNAEFNRTANGEDTIYADQKIGLMPEWTWTEGVSKDEPTFQELDAKQDAEMFRKAVDRVKRNRKMAFPLHVHDVNTYRNARLFLSDDKESGFALMGDEIGSFFSGGGGQAYPTLRLAVEEGGKRIDAYRTIMPKVLGKAGFRPVARVEFDPEQATNIWDYKKFAQFQGGKPDLVFFAHDPEFEGDINEETAKAPLVDYSEAVSLQTEAVSEQQKPKLSAAPKFATAAFGGKPIPKSLRTIDTSGLNEFIWRIQDKFIDLKNIIKELDATVGKVPDKLNAYLKEELFHFKAAQQTKDFKIKEIRPLLVEMKKRNVEMADIEKYLHNRHAEERNDHINKIGGMADGGSGIKTKDAQDYMSSLSSQDRANYEALAKMVDKITADSRKMLVDTGLEDQKTVDAWNAAYDHYVPLNRVQDDDMDANSGRTGMGQGFSVVQKVQRALGSSQEVENIIANIAALRERIIVKAEKNEIGKAVFGLALKYANSDIWLAVDPEFKKSPTQALNDLLSMGYTLVQAQNLAAEPMSRDIDPNTGQIIQRVNPLLRNGDNVLHLMVDGKEKLVFFNKRNPTAVRLIRSLKNLDVDNIGVALGSVAKVTRYFAAINTQYNPIFGIINLLRDISAGMLNLTNTPLAGQQGKVFGNIPLAMAGIWEQLRAEAKGNIGTSKWAMLFNEFELAGGPTGYRDMFATSADRADALAAEFKQLSNGIIKVKGKVVFEALSDYNTAMENGVRLSAYAAAREKGMPIEQAASLAKNLTVNFNRKGNITTQMGALYAFFNASVQGTTRIAQTLAGPAGRKIIGGGLLLGSVQAMLLAANDFGDDEPPDFVKQKNLIIPTGDGKYITIPMPLGFNLIPNFSRVVTEVFLSGGKNIPKKLAGLLEATIDGLNPIGGGTFAQIISPTVTDPIIAIVENRDAFGRRIAKQDISGLTPTPGYLRTKETATIWSKELSKFLNYASGGTEFKKGLFSPTPDQIDYLIGQGTGGIGREISKGSQSLGTLYTGEELASYKIPLVSRFYGDTKESASEANKFYTNITRINEHGLEIKGYRTHPGSGNIGEYIKENPEARLVGMASHTAQMLQNINAQKKKALERDLPKERIKQLEDLAKLHMKRFNDRVEALQ